jgi:CheY-like chemotaxis protein
MSNEPIRLLLVDDDAAITGGLAPLLTREGFDVEVAADGESTLERLAAGRVGIVVLDVMMPGMDGREVLRRLRAAGSAVPVVLLTSVGEAAERARALDEGADDYLNKPFDAGELISRVRAVLRRAAAGRPGLAAARALSAGALTWDRVARRVWLAGDGAARLPDHPPRRADHPAAPAGGGVGLRRPPDRGAAPGARRGSRPAALDPNGARGRLPVHRPRARRTVTR